MILDYITDFLIGIVFTIFFTCVGLILTLNFKSLYYNDIDLLNLEATSSLDKEVIKQNYDEIIEYVKPNNNIDIKLSNFKLSANAKTHLYEIKNIYKLVYILAIFSGLTTFIILFLKIRQHDYGFLLVSSIVSSIIPFLLLGGFATKFKKMYNQICNYIFSDNTWKLSAKADPVVNILPERFFQHCAITVFSFSLVCGLCMLTIWKGMKNKNA